jgi:hypothetical protein
MIKSEKKLKELHKVFDSGNSNDIIKRIGLLRDEDPFEGSIRALASLYDKTEDIALRQHIAGFFNDIKEPTVTTEVIETLLSPFSQGTKIMLASSCWQSGLDYTENANVIAGLYLSAEYFLALECFTILDNCSEKIPAAEKKVIAGLLKEKVKNQQGPIQQLTRELISVMRK